MKILLFIFVLLIPSFVFAQNEEDEGFILYKRPLLPGFSLVQTDETTELIFRGEGIKRYKNEEFAIELLTHGPNNEPDCYNSLSKNLSTSRFKTIVGRDYLKDCFILRSDKILNSFLLLYSPSIEGNRVSVYDIKKKKYYHWILNTVLQYRRQGNDSIIFLTKNSHDICNRSLVIFREGKLIKLTDSCKISQNGIPVKIHSFLIRKNKIEINYSDVELRENNYIPKKEEKIYKIDISTFIKNVKEPKFQTGSTLLLKTITFPQ